MQLLSQLSHEIICTFQFNHIHMLMRLSTPLNSTTFIHMLLLFIVMFSGFLPSKTPSLQKRFAMDSLHHRIAWLPCTLSPFVSNLLMNLFFFFVKKKTIGFSKKWNLSNLQNHNHSFWPSFVATRHFLLVSTDVTFDLLDWSHNLLPNVYNGELI
jgi:hypothetical protein